MKAFVLFVCYFFAAEASGDLLALAVWKEISTDPQEALIKSIENSA